MLGQTFFLNGGTNFVHQSQLKIDIYLLVFCYSLTLLDDLLMPPAIQLAMWSYENKTHWSLWPNIDHSLIITVSLLACPKLYMDNVHI